MSQEKDSKAGPLTQFMVEDHRRLDALWQSAARDRQHIDQAAYDQFRAGLLRHIGMEEKIVLPALQRLQRGTPFAHADQLRLDHGALAALLMPTPTPAILEAIEAILSQHNRWEEGADGLYAASDQLLAAEADAIVATLRAAPQVKVTPHADSPAVKKNVLAALQRAGYSLGLTNDPPA
jgi:hypothetical protein